MATLLHLHRGTPYVYQGEEIGMANYPFDSLDDVADIESVNWAHEALARGHGTDDVMSGIRHSGRDNARTPVQWDATPHAGFTTGEPWLAVNPDHVDWNVEAQREDPHSVLAHHRRLIALRHDDPVVSLGEFHMLLPEHEQVYAFARRLGDEELLVVCNVGSSSVPVADLLPAVTGGALVLGNHPDETDRREMRPWEAWVLRVS